MNGISLFSGNGGIDLALKDEIKTILYCEVDTYSQLSILSRMAEGSLEFAPIWPDVRTLDGTKLRSLVDIITAGFPCQGNSTAVTWTSFHQTRKEDP
jgi:DNA (cytosine-5)-methyltransferase 1